MRINFLTIFAIITLCCTACQADTITITYNEKGQPIVNPAECEGLKITVKNGAVKIKDWRTEPTELLFVLKGKASEGSFKLNTEAKAKIRLEGLELTSAAGAPLHLKNKKKMEVIAADGTVNTLTVTACPDTATQKAAVIWAKDKLLISGNGTLNLIAKGNGCKGINVKDDLTIEDLTLNVQTLGDNLGVDTTRNMGFGGPPPGMGFDPNNIPEEVKAQFEEMRKNFEGMMKDGNFPMMGGPGGGMGFGGMTPPEGDFNGPQAGGGFMGKQKFLSTCKGIKVKGTLTINSGKVSVTTNSRGAEGMEGKEGVTINGGEVYVHAIDDAINSGGQIIFNGGHTCAISTTNDAVDSNSGGFGFGFGGGGMPPFMMGGAEQTQNPINGETQKRTNEQNNQAPAIIINGGEVLAWSQTGPPEEGLDCDFAPIQITGGNVFSVGAGMGEMPSVPTTETAKQPTALLIGLDIQKDSPISIYEANAKGKPTGKPLATYTVPFDFQSSSSIITCPTFQVGKHYVVKSATKTYPLELTEPFTVSRQGTERPSFFPRQ